MQVNINDVLYKQISDYCSLNNLKICHYVNELLDKAFKTDKFGAKPLINRKPTKIEKDVSVEKIVTEKIVDNAEKYEFSSLENKIEKNNTINTSYIDSDNKNIEDKPKKRKLK